MGKVIDLWEAAKARGYEPSPSSPKTPSEGEPTKPVSLARERAMRRDPKELYGDHSGHYTRLLDERMLPGGDADPDEWDWTGAVPHWGSLPSDHPLKRHSLRIKGHSQGNTFIARVLDPGGQEVLRLPGTLTPEGFMQVSMDPSLQRYQLQHGKHRARVTEQAVRGHLTHFGVTVHASRTGEKPGSLPPQGLMTSLIPPDDDPDDDLKKSEGSPLRRWVGRDILHEDHAEELDREAALHEFGYKLPRAQAEAKAYDDYTRGHRHEAAAHHLHGIRAAQAVGDPEAAKKHGIMYHLHLKELGHDPYGPVPQEVKQAQERVASPHRFKAHKGDAFAVSPRPPPDTT